MLKGDLEVDLEGEMEGDLEEEIEGDSKGDSRGDFKKDMEGDLLSSLGQVQVMSGQTSGLVQVRFRFRNLGTMLCTHAQSPEIVSFLYHSILWTLRL